MSCKTNHKDTDTALQQKETIGAIERLDPALDDIIDKSAVIEIISDGHDWSESPLWIPSLHTLLFSDAPRNTVYQWTEEKGTEVYLSPSGYTGSEPSQSHEPGSNGLLLDKDGKLVLCQHGDRRMAVMTAPLDNPTSTFMTLADSYSQKRLNSPNDATFNSKGDLFFTDPPYGLPTQQDDDPLKELPYQGVYRITVDGTLQLLIDSLTRPNGIDISPDERTLIVANSDPDKAAWYAYDIDENDSLINARIYRDVTEEAKEEKGLPDGLEFDSKGNLFASGPGGIWIFASGGKLLGKIKLPGPASNCTLADNDKTLYITNDMYVLRVKM